MHETAQWGHQFYYISAGLSGVRRSVGTLSLLLLLIWFLNSTDESYACRVSHRVSAGNLFCRCAHSEHWILLSWGKQLPQTTPLSGNDAFCRKWSILPKCTHFAVYVWECRFQDGANMQVSPKYPASIGQGRVKYHGGAYGNRAGVGHYGGSCFRVATDRSLRRNTLIYVKMISFADFWKKREGWRQKESWIAK